jgi:hypothetical protein
LGREPQASGSSQNDGNEEYEMTETEVKTCIYPGCDRPAVAPHELGGPQPHFCDLEEHNAGTTHLARQKVEAEGGEGDGTPAE